MQFLRFNDAVSKAFVCCTALSCQTALKQGAGLCSKLVRGCVDEGQFLAAENDQLQLRAAACNLFLVPLGCVTASTISMLSLGALHP